MIRLLALVACAAPAGAAVDDGADPALIEIVVVSAPRADDDDRYQLRPENSPDLGADLVRAAARVPGAARIGNGELSGQLQYRGLFGERLNLRVDGQPFASGGPNLMDPIFHYAPTPVVAAVVIDRGVSPVSQGPGLGGGADATFKRVDYNDSGEASVAYDLSAGARSIDGSHSLGGVLGASTRDWRFNLLGSHERGDDTEFAGGRVAGSAFERDLYGLSLGWRGQGQELSFDARRQETGPSGNPPFPMDIDFFHTDFLRLGYERDAGTGRLRAELAWSEVDHRMDNFSQRPAPPPPRQRATLAGARSLSGALALDLPLREGTLSIGVDALRNEHDVLITHPNNAAFLVGPFPDITMGREGAFAQWRGPAGPVMVEAGMRFDLQSYDAGNADIGPALPAGPQLLAAAFNRSDRDGRETTTDGVLRIWTRPTNGFSLRGSIAHKMAMPGYIQRFGWLPISASGGLADGNTYVGDLDLEPERAWLAELGFDLVTDRAYLRPTIFWRRIDDFIQGVPFDSTTDVVDTPQEMISSMNGDATPLRWANTEARLYGVDLDAGVALPGAWRIDVVGSFVRGERRDIDDDLYRIAPPRATVGLTRTLPGGSITAEALLVAAQRRVSQSNDEPESSSYALLNLYGNWALTDAVTVSAGIENLLDRDYRDHLAGINRNGFGDVGVGARLPGAGRGAFLRIALRN